MNVANEIKDDPQWDQTLPFSWDRYWKYIAREKVFATNFNVVSFVAKTGRSVEIYKMGEQGSFAVGTVHEGSSTDAAPLRLLRSPLHYDLIVSKKRSLEQISAPTEPVAKKICPLFKRPAAATATKA